jgi:hypothetical protein
MVSIVWLSRRMLYIDAVDTHQQDMHDETI